MTITTNYKSISSSISDDVTLVIAAKTRTKKEIEEVIASGATDIGYNNVQEAERMYHQLGDIASKVRWHMIGPLQRNKINKVLPIFDVIQTVDSYKLAEAINKRTAKVMPIYIQINISGEDTKSGVEPDNLKDLIMQMSDLEKIRIEGIMGMEPYSDNPEDARQYFTRMNSLFKDAKTITQDNLDLRVLSMGMSSAYKVAVEEGSNMVRVGTAIFGKRDYN